MLAKKLKLPIQTVVGKKGKILKSPFFLVRVFPSSNSFSRFGVVVSAKAAKRATDRNRMRRSAYDLLQKDSKKLPTADYWISVSGTAGSLPKEEFIGELKKVLNI